MRTLLLNSAYFPIRIIPWDRAIKMRYEGTCDIVAEYQETASSPSVTWRIPAVVRQRQTVKVRGGVRFSPLNVFRRDKFRCQYCGEHFAKAELTCDHVVPKANGGKRDWGNIVAACKSCNSRKADRECDECSMFPLNPPVKPTWLPPSAEWINRQTAPVEWLAYLPA